MIYVHIHIYIHIAIYIYIYTYIYDQLIFTLTKMHMSTYRRHSRSGMEWPGAGFGGDQGYDAAG